MIAIAEKVEVTSKLSKSQKKKKAAQKKKVMHYTWLGNVSMLCNPQAYVTTSFQRARKSNSDNEREESLRRTQRLRDEIDARIVCSVQISHRIS